MYCICYIVTHNLSRIYPNSTLRLPRSATCALLKVALLCSSLLCDICLTSYLLLLSPLFTTQVHHPKICNELPVSAQGSDCVPTLPLVIWLLDVILAEIPVSNTTVLVKPRQVQLKALPLP